MIFPSFFLLLPFLSHSLIILSSLWLWFAVSFLVLGFGVNMVSLSFTQCIKYLLPTSSLLLTIVTFSYPIYCDYVFLLLVLPFQNDRRMIIRTTTLSVRFLNLPRSVTSSFLLRPLCIIIWAFFLSSQFMSQACRFVPGFCFCTFVDERFSDMRIVWNNSLNLVFPSEFTSHKCCYYVLCR